MATSLGIWLLLLAVRGGDDVADSENEPSPVTTDGPQVAAMDPSADGGGADLGDPGGDRGGDQLVEIFGIFAGVSNGSPCSSSDLTTDLLDVAEAVERVPSRPANGLQVAPGRPLPDAIGGEPQFGGCLASGHGPGRSFLSGLASSFTLRLHCRKLAANALGELVADEYGFPGGSADVHLMKDLVEIPSGQAQLSGESVQTDGHRVSVTVGHLVICRAGRW